MKAASLKLYDFPLAYNPAKTRLALLEKGLPYTTQNVNILNGESLNPWFMKINPKSTAPVLVADQKIITESKDTVKYVDSLGTPLGGDAVDRASVDRWVDKCSEWDGNLYIFANADAGTKGVLDSVQLYKIKCAEARKKKNPDLASVYDEKIKALQSSRTVDPAAVTANDSVLTDILQTADSTLKDQEFLAGSQYSLADVLFTVVLWRIGTVAGKQAELVDPLPHVSKYFTNVKARPSYNKAFGGTGGFNAVRIFLPTLFKVKFSSLTGWY